MELLTIEKSVNEKEKLPKKTKAIIIVNYIVLGIMLFLNICAAVFFITSNDTDIVFEDNILKVVEIKVTNDESTFGYATGCFIDSNGTILTNKHVVKDSETNENFKSIYVRMATQEEYTKAEILKVSDSDDLALIKVDFKNTEYFRLANSVDNGETIYTIGNPNGFGLSFTRGVVSSNSRNVVYNNQTIKTIQTSLVINEGNSGGPVFNKDGRLVGLISFRLKDKNDDVIQGCSFALKIETIKNFIND